MAAHPASAPQDARAEGRYAPLAEVRVLELGQAVCAPLCARHLADLGADVIKIESPGGDLARGYDSVVGGDSAYFAWANYGKRSVMLDLRSARGQATFEQLLSGTDVLVHNLAPGAMERLGLGSDHLHELNDRLIECSISGYGSTGPMAARRAFDLMVQGEAGLMAVTGTEEQPVKVGISIVDMCAAVYALAAVQAALLDRGRTGVGRVVEISLLDCIAEWMMAPAYHQLYTGHAPRREGARHNMMVPYGVYRTGPSTSVNFAVQTPAQWKALCVDVLDAPELSQDADYSNNADRVRNRSVLESELEKLLSRIGHDEVVSRLHEAGIPTGDVNDLQALLDHPQLAARQRWMAIDARARDARTIRPPFDTGPAPAVSPAVPGLGEHTDKVLKALDSGSDAVWRERRNAHG